MTKFVDDRWMRENGFREPSMQAERVGDLWRRHGRRDLVTASSSDTVADSVLRMKEKGISQLPVVDEGKLVGIVTESDLLGRLVEGHATLSSAVAEVMFRNVQTVNEQDNASTLLEMFGTGAAGVIVDDEDRLVGILTKMDLVDHLTATATVS